MIANPYDQTLRCALALSLVAATLSYGHATVREESPRYGKFLPHAR